MGRLKHSANPNKFTKDVKLYDLGAKQIMAGVLASERTWNLMITAAFETPFDAAATIKLEEAEDVLQFALIEAAQACRHAEMVAREFCCAAQKLTHERGGGGGHTEGEDEIPKSTASRKRRKRT
jgi:hypothetical protein